MDHEGAIFVYAALDSAGRIAIVDSSIFVKESTGWVQIDRSDSGSRESRDAYAHAQGNYFPGGLTNSDDTHRYMYDASRSPAYREATAEELEQERAEIEAAAYSLPDHKAARVAESKGTLADYLEEHPLLWTDGKRYSVTMEKQTLLTSALARHQIAAAAGQSPELRWNASGEECAVWKYEDLAALALAIAAYVEPLVSRQQALEVEIMAAQSREELEGIAIDYAAC